MTVLSLRDWLARADELCSAGNFFEAHEELEAGWMKAEGAKKMALQGLIQLAAGLHRLSLPPAERGDWRYLMERGTAKLHASRRIEAESLARLDGRLAALSPDSSLKSFPLELRSL